MNDGELTSGSRSYRKEGSSVTIAPSVEERVKETLTLDILRLQEEGQPPKYDEGPWVVLVSKRKRLLKSG